MRKIKQKIRVGPYKMTGEIGDRSHRETGLLSKDLKEVEQKPPGYVGPLTSGWQFGVTMAASLGLHH